MPVVPATTWEPAAHILVSCTYTALVSWRFIRGPMNPSPRSVLPEHCSQVYHLHQGQGQERRHPNASWDLYWVLIILFRDLLGTEITMYSSGELDWAMQKTLA